MAQSSISTGVRSPPFAMSESGALHAVSAVCTHMGCVVGWNPTDRTWDCGYHGSRFGIDGEVAHGPAVLPLQQLEHLFQGGEE